MFVQTYKAAVRHGFFLGSFVVMVTGRHLVLRQALTVSTAMGQVNNRGW